MRRLCRQMITGMAMRAVWMSVRSLTVWKSVDSPFSFCMDQFSRTVLNNSLVEEKLPPGRYVWMEAGDNGCGMDKETLRRLFDPFFTTKFTGRGLGMSAVLGIIRGHKGGLLIDSTPGVGTTIRVLFPIADGSGAKPAATDAAAESRDGGQCCGTVLVVDDEEMIREVSVAMLQALGFDTVTAAGGEEALRIFREQGDRISLVLLDQIMPGIDGVTVFKELRRIRPDIKVLLASGFSEIEVSERFKGLGLDDFIQKPFSVNCLSDAVQRIQARG